MRKKDKGSLPHSKGGEPCTANYCSAGTEMSLGPAKVQRGSPPARAGGGPKGAVYVAGSSPQLRVGLTVRHGERAAPPLSLGLFQSSGEPRGSESRCQLFSPSAAAPSYCPILSVWISAENRVRTAVSKAEDKKYRY
jgi:hypothetical protein